MGAAVSVDDPMSLLVTALRWVAPVDLAGTAFGELPWEVPRGVDAGDPRELFALEVGPDAESADGA